MAILKSAQAIALLNSNPSQYGTPEALRNLVNQVSVESSGKVTVLYSGKIGGIDSNLIVEGMVAQGEDVRAIKWDAR